MTNQLRILILDDEPLVLSGISMLLRTMGHRVTQAETGEDVLRLLVGGERFDLAILDLTIRNGLGAREITAQLSVMDPSMKQVVTSGFGVADALTNYSEFGFDASLPKPFNRLDLSSMLTELFG